jgi:hypothetical protein
VSDDALARLWQASPDDFVAERDKLAKELRAEGRKDEAADVKALRKPTQALWAVNQLASKRPGVIEDLVALGRQVEDATAQAFRGDGPGAVRELDRQRRHAVADATAAAAEVAAEAGAPLSPAMAARVSSTLDSAVLQEHTRDLLAHGRVPTELEAAGFGGLEGLELGGPGETAAPEQSEDRVAREQQRQHERAAEQLRRADAEADRLEAVAADAEAIAETARARADEARQQAETLRAETLRAETQRAVP